MKDPLRKWAERNANHINTAFHFASEWEATAADSTKTMDKEEAALMRKRAKRYKRLQREFLDLVGR